jgi:hypothetical protein
LIHPSSVVGVTRVDMKQTDATNIALPAVAAVGINLKITARSLSKHYLRDSEETVTLSSPGFASKMGGCWE